MTRLRLTLLTLPCLTMLLAGPVLMPRAVQAQEAAVAAGTAVSATVAQEQPVAEIATGDPAYQLAAGDRVDIKVFDEPDLSGSFDVDADGAVNLPLVGLVTVAGQDAKAAAQTLMTRLSAGFLVNPRVDVRVLTFRQVQVTGAVHSPGAYPYRDGMTVADAALLAGGLTDKAKDSPYKLNRRTVGQLTPPPPARAEAATVLMPGDTVQVDERFF